MAWKENKQLFIIIGALLISLGIIGVIITSVKRNETSRVETSGRFGIVIDAGGSGTRLYMYEYRQKKDSLNQIDRIICEDKGLTKYTSNVDSIGDLLKTCLKKAEKNVPGSKVDSVPVYIEATAGMRLLKWRNETRFNKIWAVVRDALSKSGYKYGHAKTIKGSQEGFNSFAAINYLNGGFKSNHLTGALEMGSSSLQVTFLPADKNFKGDNVTVEIDGKPYVVYAHSYLCYGRTEFERRFLAKLVVDSHNANIVDNPCDHEGHQVSKTSDYVWAPPCSSGRYAVETFGREFNGQANQTYIFKGRSNFTGCMAAIKSLLNDSLCTHSSCSFDNVAQPQLHGDFIAFSSFIYPVKFLNLSVTTNRSEYEASIRRICSMTAAEVKEIPFSEKYKYTYCFHSAYSFSFLANGIHFDDTNWKISFINYVKKKLISWTMGSQYLKKDQMSPPSYKTTHALNTWAMAVILTICIILMLLGIGLIIMVRKMREMMPVKTSV